MIRPRQPTTKKLNRLQYFTLVLPKTNAMQDKDSILNFLLAILRINSWKETLIIFYLTQYIQRLPYLYVIKIKIINVLHFHINFYKSACVFYLQHMSIQTSISNAQQPPVARGHHTGQLNYTITHKTIRESLPLVQKAFHISPNHSTANKDFYMEFPPVLPTLSTSQLSTKQASEFSQITFLSFPKKRLPDNLTNFFYPPRLNTNLIICKNVFLIILQVLQHAMSISLLLMFNCKCSYF